MTIGGPLNQLFCCTASADISYKAQSLLWYMEDRLTDSRLVIGSRVEIYMQVDRFSFSYWHKNRNLHFNYFVKKGEVFKVYNNQGIYILLFLVGDGGLVCGFTHLVLLEVQGVCEKNIMSDLKNAQHVIWDFSDNIVLYLCSMSGPLQIYQPPAWLLLLCFQFLLISRQW